MRKICIVIFILLVTTGVSNAQEGVWIRKTDMPTARAMPSTSVVNGKIYAIGGWGGDSDVLSAVEEYDPMTDTWTRKANMPTARVRLSTSVVNGKIYAIGGGPGSPETGAGMVPLPTVEEYDPVTNTWTKKADMSNPRWGLSTSTVNGKIYAIGGWDGVNRVSAVEEYDPVTDTWTTKGNTLFGFQHSSTSVVDEKIYVIGGYITTSVVQEYDPVADTWTKKTNMPTPRYYHSACVVDGKIYVVCGWIGADAAEGHQLSTVEEYDPATDTWMTKPVLPGGFASSVSAVNGRIYAIGSWIGTIVYEYDTGAGIRVTAISRQEGLTTGDESIAILGREFPPDAVVSIGNEPLTQLEVNSTLITGITPPGEEGEWDIIITAPSIDFKVRGGEFFYKTVSGIEITGITPANGKQAGGDLGSVSGSGFLSGATVTIDGNPATNVGVTDTLITLTIPPGTEGVKDVVVINPDGQKGTLRNAYTYNPLPVINRINPKYGGPLAGGTEITIAGEHFMAGVVVSIGENSVSRLDLFSPSELRLMVPSGKAGPKAVIVMNPDGQEAVLEEGFSYNPDPTITRIEPNAGSLEGGTTILITGRGFIGGRMSTNADVIIGNAEASVLEFISSTEITVETAPSDAGVKDVMLINVDGQKATLKDAFTYNPAPAITKVIPDNGRLAGGTSITIQGIGFLPGAKVFFSTDTGTLMTAPSAQAMSANIITAIAPLGKPGPKDVIIRNTDGQRVILADGFTYNPLPTITHITPNNGGSSGGTKIIIEGTGFLQGVRVAVGGNAGTAQLQDENTIQVITPGNPPGIWDVRVLNPDTQEVTAKRAFITVGEIVYNFPNPFRASRGTTFRYMTRHQVQYMTIKIFNLSGSPVDALETTGSNEVKWHNPRVHIGLYVYLVEAELENGERRQFRSMLEVQK